MIIDCQVIPVVPKIIFTYKGLHPAGAVSVTHILVSVTHILEFNKMIHTKIMSTKCYA